MTRGTRCEECGAAVVDGDGPAHVYVPAALGCWEAFTTLQAAELALFGRASAHGLGWRVPVFTFHRREMQR